jgi:hypothetical protein
LRFDDGKASAVHAHRFADDEGLEPRFEAEAHARPMRGFGRESARRFDETGEHHARHTT